MTHTIDYFEMMEPMKYYDNPEPKTDGARKKRQDIIDNAANRYIGSEKHDGDWGLFIHTKQGQNLIRSRSISKVTGKYGDLTAKLPHLAEEMDTWPDETVVIAEICWDTYGTNANTVGTILRCLPAKAVERQKSQKLVGKVFDILMLRGEDLTAENYEKRLKIADKFLQEIEGRYFTLTQVFESNFAEEADKIISAGGEGLVLQLRSNPYMPGTRTAWATLKLKQALPHMDLKVIGVLEPNRIYEGDCPETWKYRDENGTPVTKPYYMKWKNGIIVDFNGVEVSVASGLEDADREWLATPQALEMIKNGELYAEVKAMSVNDLGSLRHPALVRLRNDM